MKSTSNISTEATDKDESGIDIPDEVLEGWFKQDATFYAMLQQFSSKSREQFSLSQKLQEPMPTSNLPIIKPRKPFFKKLDPSSAQTSTDLNTSKSTQQQNAKINSNSDAGEEFLKVICPQFNHAHNIAQNFKRASPLFLSQQYNVTESYLTVKFTLNKAKDFHQLMDELTHPFGYIKKYQNHPFKIYHSVGSTSKLLYPSTFNLMNEPKFSQTKWSFLNWNKTVPLPVSKENNEPDLKKRKLNFYHYL